MSAIYILGGVGFLIACFFGGIVLIPLASLFGLTWAIGALWVRSRY
jgi:hypothetical protein